MKYATTLRSCLRFMQVLLSLLLVTVVLFTSCPEVLAAQSASTEGTVQLDKILDKTQQAIDDPALSLKDITERAKGGLNEVQGNADSSKMKHSNDNKLPVVKQAEKALKKMQRR